MPYKEEHVRRSYALKAAAEKLKLGPPVHLGISSAWGSTPRSGARWSFEETMELIQQFQKLRDSKHVQLTAENIVRLGWHFGRSGGAIDSKLGEVLRHEYYRSIAF